MSHPLPPLPAGVVCQGWDYNLRTMRYQRCRNRKVDYDPITELVVCKPHRYPVRLIPVGRGRSYE